MTMIWTRGSGCTLVAAVVCAMSSSCCGSDVPATKALDVERLQCEGRPGGRRRRRAHPGDGDLEGRPNVQPGSHSATTGTESAA